MNDLVNELKLIEKRENILIEESLHNKFLRIKDHFLSFETQRQLFFPLYSFHNKEHSETIINILSSFCLDKIFKNDPLNKYEIFYLISSAYLHDIGLMVINEEDNNKSRTIDLNNIRKTHHIRSYQYILDNSKVLKLNNFEANIISLICKGHKNTDIYNTPGYNPISCPFDPNKTIRIDLLTALLRISNELSISFNPINQERIGNINKYLKKDIISNIEWFKHYYTIGYTLSFIDTPTEFPKLLIELSFQMPNKDYEKTFIIPFVIFPIQNEIGYLQNIFNRYGFSIDIQKSPKIYFNNNLSPIPDNLNDDFFKLLIIDNEIKVLIIDDENIVRTDFSEIISDFGFKVELAVDSISALEKIQNISYHLILLDMMMPDLHHRMNNIAGLELLKMIKNIGKTSIVIILSALEESSLIIECLKNGAHDYIIKDMSKNEIKKRIEKSLKMNFYLTLGTYVEPIFQKEPIILNNNKEISNYHIAEIELFNIKCFKNLHLSLNFNKQPSKFVMILGDNATGKTTLLRCIALGLCDEGDAISLMKQLEGSFLSRDEKNGYIKIKIKQENNDKLYTITTKISRQDIESSEVVRQSMEPPNEDVRKNIFIVGYSPHRNLPQAPKSYEGYLQKDAVQLLFNSGSPLQNPEVVLLRQDKFTRKVIEDKLKNILMLDSYPNLIHDNKKGFDIEGPWGISSYKVLSDGYQSTTQWVLDFIGWAIYAGRFTKTNEIGGILLIDELEQHLHPKWQRHIVNILHQQFPNTQIISTTHSPIVATSVGEIGENYRNDMLFHLSLSNTASVNVNRLDTFKGFNIDQILASQAFDYLIDTDPDIEKIFKEASKLASKGENRTDNENLQYKNIKNALKQILLKRGRTQIEMDIYSEYNDEVRKEIKELEKLLGYKYDKNM